MKKGLMKNGLRRKLVFLPLLVLPFLTMGFWALGGGQGKGRFEQKDSMGLNLELPGAQLKEEGVSKMNCYERAERDSMRSRRQLMDDPFFTADPGKDSVPFPFQPYPAEGEVNEEKVYQKLLDLKTLLKEAPRPPAPTATGFAYPPSTPLPAGDLERLDGMMRRMETPAGEDTQLTRLNTMMEKILDIMHPERVKQRLAATASPETESFFSVEKGTSGCFVSLLDTGMEKQAPPFYSTEKSPATKEEKAFLAAVDGTQKLVPGAVLRLRLREDVRIGETTVPAGTALYGDTRLQGERLTVEIRTIRTGSVLLPVHLTLYDLDAIEGIRVPGAGSLEAVKETADRSLQGIDMVSWDPSLTSQAAAAGIQTARSLLRKKIKSTPVQIKEGYQVLLKEN
jgi:conjugative transposon TraM protein